MTQGEFQIFGRLVLEDRIQEGTVQVRGGRVAGLIPGPPERDAGPVIESPDTVWPGLVDIHVHGAGGADVMDATPDALDAMSKELAKHGVARFLATTVTEEESRLVRALENVRDSADRLSGARIAGVHLEGPFISSRRVGAQNPRYVATPSREAFERLQNAAGGAIRLVTFAPELPGALEMMAGSVEEAAGVIWSVGHSDGTFSEVERAREAGAVHVTHCFNAMRGFHHRDPGVAGAALYFDDLTTELIADGVHTHEKTAALLVKIKEDRVILVSDGIRAVGMPPGEYDLGGLTVRTDGRRAALADGTLAGSLLTLEKAVANIREFAGISLPRAVRMASLNPAGRLGADVEFGRLSVGARADVVLVDGEGRVEATFVDGARVFSRSG